MTPNIQYKVFGQGTPTIILHGLFGMSDNLVTLAKQLEAEGHMVYLIDQRDHGRSEHTDAFNYALLAEDLHQFMEENWLYKANLIGHSMGGKTVLEYLTHYSDRVDKCVIIDIGVKKYEEGHQAVFEALFNVPIETVQSRGEVETILMDKLQDYGTVQFLMKNLTRKKEGGYEWKLNLALLHREYANILEAITYDEICEADILFIRGERSDYILDSDISGIVDIFPKAKFVSIANAGHWVHVDSPNELFEEINTFIKP